MSIEDNLQLDSDFTAQQYSPPLVPSITNVFTGNVSPVVTINGNAGGGASGPSVTLSGGVTGYEFNATGNTIALQVLSAATVRSSISAAKSGVNSDLTQFTALTGSGGWTIWTGTADKTTHVTYPATVASALYSQAEVQGLMDKMKEMTEAFKALQDTLLAGGEIKP